MSRPDADTVLDGRYRLLRRLGSGGMAAVWVARDERLGREVAVKILSELLADEEQYRRRFEREARVAARLDHPGLVGIYDFSAQSRHPYLVMELVRGDTLADRIAVERFGELGLRALARELLGALAYIHAAGVVHRDVKPANVLIGPDGRARLTDFGIAQPKDATTLTQTGQLIGTLSYMAPEVGRGEPATPRSDLYSLGVMLRKCGGERDPALGPLIARLSADDPARRPASATEALATLTGTAATVPLPGTEATEPLAQTERPAPVGRHSGGAAPARVRRLWLTSGRLRGGLAVLAAVVVVVLAWGAGDGETPSDVGRAGQGTESPSGSGEPATEPASTPPATEAGEPESETSPSAEPSRVSCAAIEEQNRALEEKKNAAEVRAGDDRAAKKAIKAQFEADKKMLQERAKTCEKR